MVVHQVFAQILNDKIENLILAETYGIADQITKLKYGENAFAVDATQYPVLSGYKYIDSNFIDLYGNIVKRTNTVEEDAKYAHIIARELQEQIAEQDELLLETNFHLLLLQNGFIDLV